ncbi:hypothetical protein EV1_002321 [Malus domestica]
MAGRKTLKAVAIVVPCYPMSCFKFPKVSCNSTNGALSNFWWGESETGNKLHRKSWKNLCESKNKGGMGFRELEMFNMALLAKHVWRMVDNPDALWVRVLKARYFPRCDIFTATRGSRPSWAWTSLLEGRKVIMRDVKWQLGDGTKIRIWNDNWLPTLSSTCLRPTRIEPGPLPTMVSSLIDVESASWKLESIAHPPLI